MNAQLKLRRMQALEGAVARLPLTTGAAMLGKSTSTVSRIRSNTTRALCMDVLALLAVSDLPIALERDPGRDGLEAWAAYGMKRMAEDLGLSAEDLAGADPSRLLRKAA